jgi:hypothetical protein
MAAKCVVCLAANNVLSLVISSIRNWRLAVLPVVVHVCRLEPCTVFNYDVGRLLRIVLLLYHLEGLQALISGSGPSRRNGVGFAATPDGMLYVFGGYDGGTERGSVGHWGCAGRSHAACTRCAAAALALSCGGDEGEAGGA